MNFLRNCWYVAGWAEELVAGEILPRTILDEPVALFRREDGTPAAVIDTCPHRFAPLSAGTLQRGNIVCGYHGLGFGGDGSCAINPHGPVLKSLSIRAFPVKEAHRALWIWMGDPDHADEALIPDFGFLAEVPDTAFSAGSLLSGKGNYLLFVDNILDLSHADYLHPTTLGGGIITRAKQEIEEADQYFDVTWYSRDVPPMPFVASLMNALPERTDVFQRVRWYAPGVMKLEAGVMAAGAPESEAMLNSNAHFMTPETGFSTHYFFAATRNFRQSDGELNQRIAESRARIFATEDKPMLEKVADRMQRADFFDMRPALMPIDGAAVRARRLMQARIEAEGGQK